MVSECFEVVNVELKRYCFFLNFLLGLDEVIYEGDKMFGEIITCFKLFYFLLSIFFIYYYIIFYKYIFIYFKIDFLDVSLFLSLVNLCFLKGDF